MYNEYVYMQLITYINQERDQDILAYFNNQSRGFNRSEFILAAIREKIAQAPAAAPELLAAMRQMLREELAQHTFAAAAPSVTDNVVGAKLLQQFGGF